MMDAGCARQTAAIVGAPFALVLAVVVAVACTTRIAPDAAGEPAPVGALNR